MLSVVGWPQFWSKSFSCIETRNYTLFCSLPNFFACGGTCCTMMVLCQWMPLRSNYGDATYCSDKPRLRRIKNALMISRDPICLVTSFLLRVLSYAWNVDSSITSHLETIWLWSYQISYIIYHLSSFVIVSYTYYIWYLMSNDSISDQWNHLWNQNSLIFPSWFHLGPFKVRSPRRKTSGRETSTLLQQRTNESLAGKSQLFNKPVGETPMYKLYITLLNFHS